VEKFEIAAAVDGLLHGRFTPVSFLLFRETFPFSEAFSFFLSLTLLPLTLGHASAVVFSRSCTQGIEANPRVSNLRCMDAAVRGRLQMDVVPRSWWERFGGEGDEQGRGEGFSTVESVHCYASEDERGQPVRRCERVRRKLRQVPGQLPEEVESSREHTDGSELPESPSLFPEDAETFLREPDALSMMMRIAEKHMVHDLPRLSQPREHHEHPGPGPSDEQEPRLLNFFNRWIFPGPRGEQRKPRERPAAPPSDLTSRIREV
jgi:hypothetical protein